MNNLTKNFNFIDKEDKFIYETTREIENRFLNGDYKPIATSARKITEAILKQKKSLEGDNLSQLIYQYKGTWGDPIVVDALYQIKKWGNQESHYSKNKEKINFTNALFILKSLSLLLQSIYLEKPDFAFSEVPYQKNKEKPEVLIDNSIASSELKIQKTSLFNWLKSKHIIFKIPFYQRNYTWKNSNLEVLLEDIKNRNVDQHKHYFGVIAIKKEVFLNNDVQLKIIDGQQRITTSLILLRAAYDYMKDKGKIIAPLKEIFENEDIFKRYSNDSAKEGEINEFRDILKGKYIHHNNSWKYGENYHFILNKFNNLNWDEVSLYVFTFINKFRIAELEYDIAPDREMDVFENMNSKGTELKEWDLIRNQIFNSIKMENIHDSKKVQILEENFIHDFTRGWTNDKNYDELSNFFVEYIYSKIVEGSYKKYLQKENFPIYYNFKELHKDLVIKSKLQYIELLKDFKKYSSIYKSLLDRNIAMLDKRLSFLENRWFNISQKKQIYPSIISLFIKFGTWNGEKWKINDIDNLIKGIKFIDSIFIRLEVSKGFGHSLRNSSLKLAELILEENDFEIIVKKIKESESFIIEDQAFASSLRSGSIKQTLTHKMLLEANKFLIDVNKHGIDIFVSNPSLEHVMPKTIDKWVDEGLSDIKDWKSEFDKHLNLLGNFYVLPKKLNSKLSNSIFSQKKFTLLELKTPMIIGDKKNGITSLAKINEWTFEIIEKRTEELVSLLVKKIYPIFDI